MSSAVQENRTPIESREQLLEYFESGETAREDRGVGTEHEKFVLHRSDLSMVAHEDEGGLQELFEALVESFGWEPDYECNWIIGLKGGSGAITLEPGGQFELSGAVQKTIHQTEEELDEHFRQLREVAGDQLYFTCWGMNPFYGPDEVPLVPKQRYDIMRTYLPTRGVLSPWMMKASCTIQANFDYRSESDAADIVRTALLISPLVSALFANSPYESGRDTGMASFRGFAWTQTDGDRTGWPQFMYGEDWGFEQYLDWILDVPMFFVERRNRLIPMIGMSFRDFLRGKHASYDPLMQDFELHLSTAFPEIRMKKYIEVRGADGGPREMMLALPALWKGIVYHEPTRRRAAALLEGIGPEAHAELFMDVYEKGLHAEASNGRVRELAAELVRLAGEGLDALAEEQGHASETSFLAPLERIVDSGEMLSDQLREDLRRFDDRREIVETWNLL